jgi:hypothetical protein
VGSPAIVYPPFATSSFSSSHIQLADPPEKVEARFSSPLALTNATLPATRSCGKLSGTHRPCDWITPFWCKAAKQLHHPISPFCPLLAPQVLHRLRCIDNQTNFNLPAKHSSTLLQRRPIFATGIDTHFNRGGQISHHTNEPNKSNPNDGSTPSPIPIVLDRDQLYRLRHSAHPDLAF